MSLADLEKKIANLKDSPNPTMPTQEQINAAKNWVINEFPYFVAPSHNPKQGKDIQAWLDSNVGEMDKDWTWLGLEIRFRRKEDYVLYGLTWQKFDEESGSRWIPQLSP